MIATLVAVVATGAAAHAQGQSPQAATSQPTELNLSAYAELLRRDVSTQKIAILSQVMGFTETEDAAFWPIYREYDLQMSRLGDERVALVAEYARQYAQMTEAAAAELGDKAVALEARRQDAKAACYERVKKALSPRTALRFLQVEQQLLLLIDLQISAALPIIE